MPAPLRWTARLRDELLRRRAQGETIDQLLAWLRLHGQKASRSGLWSRLRAEGAAPVYKQPKPEPAPTKRAPSLEKRERNAAILAVLAAGRSQADAARCFGISRQRVYALAKARRLAIAAAKATLSPTSCLTQDASPPPPSAAGCSAEGSAPARSPS